MGNTNQHQQPTAPQPKKYFEMSKEEQRDKQRELQRQLNREENNISKEMMKIDFQKKQIQQQLEKEIKKGPQSDKMIKATYAKQVLACDKNKTRYLNNKLKIQGLKYQMDNFFAQIKMAQTMKMTSDVMKSINDCMNIKEMNEAMKSMQKEMMKMGIMDEMINDALGSMDEDSNVDNDLEVEKLIMETEQKLAVKPVIKDDIIHPQVDINNQNLNQQPEQLNDVDDFEKKLASLK